MSLCPHCGRDSEEPRESLPWYFRTSIIILGFFTAGPLALPLVWLHPKYSLNKKLVISAAVLLVSYVLGVACYNSLKEIIAYYQAVFQ